MIFGNQNGYGIVILLLKEFLNEASLSPLEILDEGVICVGEDDECQCEGIPRIQISRGNIFEGLEYMICAS